MIQSLWKNSLAIAHKVHVRLFVTPWTVARQAPLSMGFSRQEYCSGLPYPCPGDLPNPGIEPRSPALQADPLLAELPGKPIYVHMMIYPYLTDFKGSGINTFQKETANHHVQIDNSHR